MLSSRAPQRQESGPFCSCRADCWPIPRKKTPVAGLCWPRAGGQRVGDIGPWAASRLPPRGPAERGFLKRAGAGFGANGGSGPVRGNSAVPASGTRRACRVFGWGLSEHENRPVERTISDLGLDTQAMADRRRRGELHQVHLDVRETLQRLLEGAIAPEWGQKRAAGPSAGANRVPPAL